MRRSLLLLLLSLSACQNQEEASPKPSPTSGRPVVVYIAVPQDRGFDAVLAEFTRVTGIQTIVRRGNPAAIVQDVIDDDIATPADVLITHSVAVVSVAAEEGALRAQTGSPVVARSPAGLHDPDLLWLALGYSPVVVVRREDESATGGDLAAMADASSATSLCLSSSSNPANRAAIAALIKAYEVRPAELLVRGWLKKLDGPPLPSAAALIEAIRDGQCATGLTLAADAIGVKGLRLEPTAPAATEGIAIGIARHARNPLEAQQLIDWLFSPSAQEQIAAVTALFPAVTDATVPAAVSAAVDRPAEPVTLSQVAWFAHDATRLAERARYP